MMRIRHLTKYGYDLAGNLTAMQYGNGVTNQYQYDSLNRLTNLVWNLNATSLAKFSYLLGQTGNRTNLNETVNGTSRSYQWQYDGLYRLTNENISAIGSLGYSYDPVGNRTNRLSGGSQMPSLLPTTSYAYTTNDWLTTDKYDNNGNTTNSNSGPTVYQYDVMNHLTNAGGILMTYDGDGNRMSKTANGTTTYYLIDDVNPSGYSQVLEEWTSTGTPVLSKVYNYGLDLISQVQPGVSTNYFICDGHGSTRMLVGAGGNIVNVFAYDAFGSLIASNGASQTAYLYCGQQWDSDLGFYLNRARYLNPDTGRFWTMDSYDGDDEDPLSLHKYLYAQDNPVNRIDPSGHGDFTLISVLTVISIGVNLEFASIDYRKGNYGLAAFDIFGALAGSFGLIEDALPAALKFAPVITSAGANTLTAAQSLQGLSALIAATDLSRAMTGQRHHIMTDKNTISTAPNGEGPFTPKFEELLAGTGIKLSDDLNLVDVVGHSGPHPEANKYVYDALENAVEGIPRNSPQYKQAIIDTLRKLGNECVTPGTKLNSLITGP